MKVSSPLRYPGGKAAMTGLLSQTLKLNGLGNRDFAEPYAGGAGASLSLLYLEETRNIHINDLDPAIYDFWWTLVKRPEPFIKKLNKTRVSMAEWHRQRKIYKMPNQQSRIRLAFSAFYLNRCNRSGIIMNGGPIGGMQQLGTWKLKARYNKTELRRRCEKVIEYSNRIHVTHLDGIKFIGSLEADKTFFFIDPPYFGKGKTLYLNVLDNGYHSLLASKLKLMPDAAWILTYDDCPEIREMYQGWATIREFSLQYSAAKRRNGNEILIAPPWLRLPEVQNSKSIGW